VHIPDALPESGHDGARAAVAMRCAMNKIPLPEYEAVPMDDVADGVRGLRIVMVNVFAVSASSAGWTLVDTGLPLSADRIENWTREHVGTGPRPNAIVLTHGHFDHVGALEELAERWNVPVYAHELELPYITGEASYPRPDPRVGGGLMAMMSSLYPRGPVNAGPRATPLPADGSIPSLPGWRWIHTPGHTVGHVSLFRDGDGTLIAGDAFCTTKQESLLAVAQQRPELHGPPAYYTTDWADARASVERLAALNPTVIAPGHGLAMSGPHTSEALQELAAKFDEVARPEQGRYIEHPTKA
jgi:glyoxylase-like metal-dependent hydrolase (beta-lactamase superfamily II)